MNILLNFIFATCLYSFNNRVIFELKFEIEDENMKKDFKGFLSALEKEQKMKDLKNFVEDINGMWYSNEVLFIDQDEKLKVAFEFNSIPPYSPIERTYRFSEKKGYPYKIKISKEYDYISNEAYYNIDSINIVTDE